MSAVYLKECLPDRSPLDPPEKAPFPIDGELLPQRYESLGHLFHLDPPGMYSLYRFIGGCEAPLFPAYESKVVQALGDHEIIQDRSGRWLKVFSGRRQGFMPTYLKHVVSSRRDWEEEVKPRLDPDTPGRWTDFEEKIGEAKAAAEAGMMVQQDIIGGYMYLRVLIGPEKLLYAFYDMPDLVHSMMAQWTLLVDSTLARVQARMELDELYLEEDICYNHGLLISPGMFREFLLPYYQEVVGKARKRQKRKLYFQVDTDGYAPPAIPLYLEAGMDVMTPFEVASRCDVVALAKEYPGLIMTGGIDKRVLAAGMEAIEEHLTYIIPAMVQRGGYVPMCDHGVPDDVSFENYMYYRNRICELDH